MEILNPLIDYDKQLLLFLHSQGYIFWDDFWIFITNPLHWIPLFFVIYFLGYRAFGTRKSIYIAIITALSAASSLMLVNLIKNYFQRLRPLNDSSINKSIRVLVEYNDFSFVSGHSTVSFTIAFLSFWILKKQYKYSFFIFLFPLLFAYSRIYLAAHFPTDILFGMLLGYLIALFFYKILKRFIFKPSFI
ncbi:phosphatase PAP2 family protein [Lutibacter flavus]|uniref:Undecaprenyl-diphosphatase n=1 Tax=Lutibacter flavus TaxID=691689 RepID=A0A238X6U4_9FLAO|nr:phosphatase PAP2 family protein [Lutibacter flavus]SNR54352.1 undecaprenyl-diphosphatase [Lutibacter flavus]